MLREPSQQTIRLRKMAARVESAGDRLMREAHNAFNAGPVRDALHAKALGLREAAAMLRDEVGA